ncbi:MAG: radical SAM protein [Bacteroidales bacterium]|nr:radical SAM protein [Bacteroidales bacterium]
MVAAVAVAEEVQVLDAVVVDAAAVVVVDAVAAEVVVGDTMKTNFPQHITFQWHITDQCNLRCKHCYQHEYRHAGMDLKSIDSILNKLLAFVNAMKNEHPKISAHINFTGGEPFIRKDFLDILKITVEKQVFSFAILSNGLLLPKIDLLTLKKHSPRFIQLSLEGDRKLNDSIRGKDSFKNTCIALKTYSDLGIPTMVSFTANANNYKYFPRVAKTAKKYGAFKVWTDRYLPGNTNDPLHLSKEEALQYFNIIRKTQRKYMKRGKSAFSASSDRALQFLECGGRPYRCAAGKTLITIMPNGDVYPCRRLPIKVGNILEQTMLDIYANNHTLKSLRNDECNDCQSCYYSKSCNGGLKCLSYAVYNNYNRKDPHCGV